MSRTTPSRLGRNVTGQLSNAASFLSNSMFFNSVQNFDTWKLYFDDPQGSMLGLLGALYQIGSLVSIPIV